MANSDLNLGADGTVANNVVLRGNGAGSAAPINAASFTATSAQCTNNIFLYTNRDGGAINKYNDSGITIAISSFSGTSTKQLCSYLATSASTTAGNTYEFHYTANSEL